VFGCLTFAKAIIIEVAGGGRLYLKWVQGQCRTYPPYDYQFKIFSELIDYLISMRFAHSLLENNVHIFQSYIL